jgi:hypothetical protein
MLAVALRRAALVALLVSGAASPGEMGHALATSPPLPIAGEPYGKSYREWAAEWWQWSLQIPASVNPATDQTGRYCSVGQRGAVWFLAGLFGGGTVERTCSVPKGVALLFPLVNGVWLSTKGDPAYGLYPGDPRLRQFAASLRREVACVQPARRLQLWVDGVSVPGLDRFGEDSRFFAVELPPDHVFSSILGPDPVLLTPNVDSGYYVLFRPLPPGRHTLRWIARDGCGNRQEVTYHLRVGVS